MGNSTELLIFVSQSFFSTYSNLSLILGFELYENVLEQCIQMNSQAKITVFHYKFEKL